MDNFRNAVKAFIVKDGKALLIKRRPNDAHKPGEWDLPGGRLELGENPFDGLKREAREEIGADIDIVLPLDVHYFTREDGQKIQLTIFLCHLSDMAIKLSEEHTEYKWQSLDAAKAEFPTWLHKVVERYNSIHYEK